MFIDNGNPFRADKALLATRSAFWYDELFKRAFSEIRWTGLPSTVNPTYLTASLLIRGFVLWTKYGGDLYALRGAVSGVDPYGFPTDYEIANPVLPQKHGKIGDGCVWGRVNAFGTPLVPVIQDYAEQLARIDVDVIVNLDNFKLATIFRAGNASQAQKIRNLYGDIVAGKPAVIVDDDIAELLGSDRQLLFTTPVNYAVNQMLVDQRTVISNYLTAIGIENIPFEKRERLVTGETLAGNADTAVCRMWMLDYLVEQTEAVNKMFGTNITVTIGGKLDEAQYNDDRDERPDDNDRSAD